MKKSACGSAEFESPPFPFPPPGASRGHRRLRCATARAPRRPQAERSNASWAGKELGSWVGGSRPLAPAQGLSCQADRSRVNQTGHLDLLTTPPQGEASSGSIDLRNVETIC